MTASHNDNITVNVYLDPVPAGEAGFSRVLFLAENVTLNGARSAVYGNYDEVKAASDAGYVNSAVLAAAVDVFAQNNLPTEWQVGKVDVAGGESYSDALAAVIADDDGFYGVTMQSRTDATIAALAATVDTSSKKMLLFAQSSESDWLTAGVPAAYSSVDDVERFAVVYHDDDAQYASEAYATERLSFDPDERSVPWNAVPLLSIDDYASTLTSAQKTNLDDNNANHGLPFGGQDFVIDPGKSIAGRPLYEQYSADWFETRLVEEISATQVEWSANGKKLPVSTAGQAVIEAIIGGLLRRGVEAGHFEDGFTITAETITQSDIDNQRLRFTVRARIAVSARLFTLNVYLSTSPV
jgi:hypothetical protein